MVVSRILPCFSAIWILWCVVCAQDPPKGYILPAETSTPVFEISARSLLEIERIDGDWALAAYGSQKAWVRVSEILVFPDISKKYSKDKYLRLDFSSEFEHKSWASQLQDLIDFATAEERMLARETDLVARQKVKETNREWGRLFVFKTPMYRAQGFRLYSFLDERCSVNLAQGKPSSKEALGRDWSEALEDRLLESNRGVLRNRSLFKHGRSYLLELRYSF